MSGIINFLRSAGFVAKIYYLSGHDEDDFDISMKDFDFDQKLMDVSTSLSTDSTKKNLGPANEDITIIPKEGVYLLSGAPALWKRIISDRFSRRPYKPYRWITLDVKYLREMNQSPLVKDITKIEALVDKDDDYWFIIIYSADEFANSINTNANRLLELFEQIPIQEGEDPI